MTLLKGSLTVTQTIWLALVILAAFAWGSAWPGWLIHQYQVVGHPLVHGAWFWNTSCQGLVCRLCPRQCFLTEGMKGWCRVRVNLGGQFYTLVYGKPAAVHIDPIEKKPVFHLLPGSRAFSLATAGCNLECNFCQNWSLSQSEPETLPFEALLPQQLVEAALHTDCRSIAYTYSEPVIFYEYLAETARLAKKSGLYNVMISAGYIQPQPLQRLLPDMDVVKVDLKGFDQDYYQRLVNGSLAPVLRTLKIVAAKKVQLEIVNLVVPTQNDSPQSLKALSHWVKEELGPETPLFFSRFSPGYRMLDYPITPDETLHQARKIARAEGLKFVYLGNVTGDEGENTYCPQCGRLLIHRIGFAVLANNLKQGRCPFCGTKIPGIWE